MECGYFDAGRCRSCELMGVPYARALADKDAHDRALLAPAIPAEAWIEAAPSPASGFRNKAKLVVGGIRGSVTLGILDDSGAGTDLRGCGLYEPAVAAALGPLADFIDETRLEPYLVPQRRGELKHVVVTGAPSGQLMVRFVLRTAHHVDHLRSRLPRLLAALPAVAVASVNLQPAHKAVLDGGQEIPLTVATRLPVQAGAAVLEVGPASFFQTNTTIAAELYAQARSWVAQRRPDVVWDLYCGVGGFALNVASALPPTAAVFGVEVSADAIAGARAGVARLGTGTARATFEVGDALEWARSPRRAVPSLVIVNPPRRGVGPDLARLIEAGSAECLIYSSCNPETLLTDLTAMPSFVPRQARVFDMFPQTRHTEVMVLASRR